MRHISPTTIHAIIQNVGITPRDFLAQLLVAKKLYVRYGMQLSKKQTITAISSIDMQLASTLIILQELWCKSAEDVMRIIRDCSRHEDFYLCDINASRSIDEQQIDAIIEKDIHTDNIYSSKRLITPGLHITTNSHRYSRTLADDMDKMLWDRSLYRYSR